MIENKQEILFFLHWITWFHRVLCRHRLVFYKRKMVYTSYVAVIGKTLLIHFDSFECLVMLLCLCNVNCEKCYRDLFPLFCYQKFLQIFLLYENTKKYKKKTNNFTINLNWNFYCFNGMGTVYIYSFFCDFTSEKFEKHNKFSIEYINGRSKTSIEIKKKINWAT